MASSKLMSSSSSNPDLKRKLSACASSNSTLPEFLRSDSANIPDGFSISDGRPSVESALLNAEITVIDAAGAVAPISDGDAEPRQRRKTVDDVWREIVAGKREERAEKKPKEEMMTLEDFLVKAGAVEGVKEEEEEEEEIGGLGGMGRGGGGGRRSMSLLEPLDKAAQQRQRRMIKNRESAARSRERKQAYQVELESMAVRLEEENERLLKEKAEQMKKRLKQLKENVIPVVERRRPPRLLRKVHSMQW